MLEIYIVGDICGPASPSIESGSVLYITPTYTFSVQELIKQGMPHKYKSPACDVKKTIGMSNLAIYFTVFDYHR